jgi:hypothetical protein
MRLYLLIATAVVAGCQAIEGPQITCQKRIVAAREASPSDGDRFGFGAYSRLDRSGCSANQVATVDRLLALIQALPGQIDANERQARQGDERGQMAAFQRMNDTLIELNDLQQKAGADLARMVPPQ